MTLPAATATESAPTAVVGLRCEYRTNPLGLDLPRPRLSWRLDTDRTGARQIAYQIRAARSADALAAGNADLWDTGRVDSDRTTHVLYEGPTLAAGERAYWAVRVWDETGATADAPTPAHWEAGPLTDADWRGARWIESSLVGGPQTTAPCPYLRKPFALAAGKTVASARLWATALGLYEAHLNGVRVGEDVLTPGWTDYNTRVQYQAYDVSHLLSPGEDNTLGAILADGWYSGHVEWRGRQRYGDRPRFLACLVVRYDDGSEETIVTDETWRWSSGPILESDMLQGESYDARLELPGWCAPGDEPASGEWNPVHVADDPGIKRVGMRGPTVRATEEIEPVAEPRALHKWPSPDYVFDLGVNLVGRVRIRVKGPRGATIRLRFAESLKQGPNSDEGAIYTENLRSARQTDHYTLKGDPDGEVYESRFTFHGFRYVEWSAHDAGSGVPEPPTRGSLTAVVLHSDNPRTGDFVCSDPLLTQLQKNIDWGWRGNSVDIPTDCPQRDERLGWTGDAQVFIRTAAFNRDVNGFFAKWFNDIDDSQGPEGQIPPVIPNTGVAGGDGGPAWADAAIICPWTIFQCYGDTGLLAEHYGTMQRFVGYLEGTAKDHIRVYPGYDGFFGFGDWLALDGSGKTDGGTPKDLIGTAFLAHDARLMARIASVLNKNEDAARYETLFEQTRKAFVARYVTPEGLVFPGTQTAYVLALHFDLLPTPEMRAGAMEGLAREIKTRGDKLSTGFVGSPYLPHVLSDNGRLDLAYKLLHQKQWPSWLYAVTQGATTIWERWDGWTHDKGFQDVGMNSFNHYAYGAIGDWLYKNVAGIDTSDAPDGAGFKKLVMRPRIEGSGLTSASAYLETPHGRAESAWGSPEGGPFRWTVTVPPNTTATVYVPAGADRTVGGGDAPGLTPAGRSEDAAVFEAVAGTYAFEVK